MDNKVLKIIVIDDNPKIHEDIIKVLSIHTGEGQSEKFEQLDDALFGEKTNDAESKPAQPLPMFEFETATQGQEGVKKIKQAFDSGLPYALAFVDVRMPPGWDGIETVSHIWDIDPEIQIVICTAYSDYSWEETIEKLGMNDNFIILKKPFDSVAVRQIACALTRKWLLARDAQNHTLFLQKSIEDKTKSLQQSLSLLRATIESSKDAVMVVDLNNKVVDYNNNIIKMVDVPDVLMKTKDAELILQYISNKIEAPAKYQENLKRFKKERNAQTKQVLHMKDAKVLECYSQPYLLNNAIAGRVWGFHDVTEQEYLKNELEYQASHDALTGLPNRILLYDRIKKEIDVSIRNQKSFAILFFDLDRFKLINDSLGHNKGDELLCAVANRLRALIRKSDTLSRLGGDEFVMLLPDVSNAHNAMLFAQKINDAFKRHFNIASREISISSSIGICLYPTDGKTVSTLLRSADLAMYNAKEQGGNRFYFYTEKLNKEAQKRLTQESELRQAIAKEQFFLVYQPQFSISHRDFIAVEALIRWRHPTKGVILPYFFIPIAEESGLIVPIGEWVIREVCKQIKAWHDAKLPYIRVAVNVAAEQLKQLNFDEVVQGILKEYNVPPEYLEIEITENVIITHKEIMRMLDKLKKIGVSIILDDFGTGNSGFNFLKQISIDCLKIDRSFVNNISKSRCDEVIIEAIIAMAKSMDLKVTAEGVENQIQLEFLKNKRCDTVQGFYYSKPIDAKELVKYLQSVEDKK